MTKANIVTLKIRDILDSLFSSISVIPALSASSSILNLLSSISNFRRCLSTYKCRTHKYVIFHINWATLKDSLSLSGFELLSQLLWRIRSSFSALALPHFSLVKSYVYDQSRRMKQYKIQTMGSYLIQWWIAEVSNSQ